MIFNNSVKKECENDYFYKWCNEKARNDFLSAQRDYLIEKLCVVEERYYNTVASNEVLRTYNSRMADEIDKLVDPASSKLKTATVIQNLTLENNRLIKENDKRARLIDSGTTENNKIRELEWQVKTLLNEIDGKAKRKGISQKRRNIILSRDGYRCQYCGRPVDSSNSHIDHVYPVSHGGKTVDSNLVTSCIPCNMSKSNTIGMWPNHLFSNSG